MGFASVDQWLAPAIVAGIVGVVLGALLNHRFGTRRDKLSDDRTVLDEVIDHMDPYELHLKNASLALVPDNERPEPLPSVREVLQRIEAGSTPGGSTIASKVGGAIQPDLARSLLGAWDELRSAGALVGRLSLRRYDGLRAFGRRLATAHLDDDLRATLAQIVRGTAVSTDTVFEDAWPFKELRTDAAIYRTMAIVYRRRGPLHPGNRLWWRTKTSRARTSTDLVAVLRSSAGSSDTVSEDELRRMLESNPEIAHLPSQEKNILIYRILNDWI